MRVVLVDWDQKGIQLRQRGQLFHLCFGPLGIESVQLALDPLFEFVERVGPVLQVVSQLRHEKGVKAEDVARLLRAPLINQADVGVNEFVVEPYAGLKQGERLVRDRISRVSDQLPLSLGWWRGKNLSMPRLQFLRVQVQVERRWALHHHMRHRRSLIVFRFGARLLRRTQINQSYLPQASIQFRCLLLLHLGGGVEEQF